jgi:NADPH:quinone reductase-like Zn-dependent oxidoreductase
MQAVLLKEFGGPEVMYLGQAPQPKLQDGQVLIKVDATSVNQPDSRSASPKRAGSRGTVFLH